MEKQPTALEAKAILQAGGSLSVPLSGYPPATLKELAAAAAEGGGTLYIVPDGDLLMADLREILALGAGRVSFTRPS